MALTHSFNLYSYNTVILMKVYENVFLKLAYMPNYASVFLLTGIAETEHVYLLIINFTLFRW